MFINTKSRSFTNKAFPGGFGVILTIYFFIDTLYRGGWEQFELGLGVSVINV